MVLPEIGTSDPFQCRMLCPIQKHIIKQANVFESLLLKEKGEISISYMLNVSSSTIDITKMGR